VELEALIQYRSSTACFRIHTEGEGIYTAYLISFNGQESQLPPDEITLLKGVRNWTGSTEDDVLLDKLGEFINTHWMQHEDSPSDQPHKPLRQ